MTDEEKANLLKEADAITSKELACFELADLVKHQYDAFIINGFDKQQATYLSSSLLSIMVDRVLNRN
nr:MAG TPA: hypothetical protein [Caudoviricetes sp.]